MPVGVQENFGRSTGPHAEQGLRNASSFVYQRMHGPAEY